MTCFERLHTSANIAQQETTMLAKQCCVFLRAFAWALHNETNANADPNAKKNDLRLDTSRYLSLLSAHLITVISGHNYDVLPFE